MEDRTCPNCNLDLDEKELRENFLRCPNCGHDLSEPEQDEENWEETLTDEEEDEKPEEES